MTEQTGVTKAEVAPQAGEAAAQPVAKATAAHGGVEKVPVEVAKATTEAVEKAMNQVTRLVESIAKAANANGGAVPAAADADVEKPFDPRQFMKAKLEKAGMKGKELEKAMSEYDEKSKASVTKAAEVAPDADAEVSKVMEVLAEAVTKAKTFTPKRQQALQKAITDLQKLLGEMMDVPQGEGPKNTLPAGTKFGESQIAELTKQLTELAESVKKGLGGMAEVTKTLNSRVESIEKIRNPSTVIPDSGTDVKVQKQFWSGLL